MLLADPSSKSAQTKVMKYSSGKVWSYSSQSPDNCSLVVQQIYGQQLIIAGVRMVPLLLHYRQKNACQECCNSLVLTEGTANIEA